MECGASPLFNCWQQADLLVLVGCFSVGEKRVLDCAYTRYPSAATACCADKTKYKKIM